MKSFHIPPVARMLFNPAIRRGLRTAHQAVREIGQQTLVFMVSIMLALGPTFGGARVFAQTATPVATLSSDKPDYSPDSEAILTGSGFQPGETVTVQVVHTDGDPNTVDPVDQFLNHQPWTVVADGSGNITTAWYVAPDCSGTMLQATAVGSSATATVTFTDNGQVVDAILGWQNVTKQWTASNGNGQNSSWKEGDTVPLQFNVTNLVGGQSHTVILSYDFIDNKGNHFYDGLYSYNASGANPDTPGTAGSPSTFAIPTDTSIPAAIRAEVAGGQLTTYNISNVTFGATPYGMTADGLSKTLTLTFTAANSGTAYILFGGHLAKTVDWNPGAANFPGGSGSAYEFFDSSSTIKSSTSPQWKLNTSALTAVKVDQTITFSGATHTYNNTTFALSATTTSGLPITFGVGTVTGGTATTGTISNVTSSGGTTTGTLVLNGTGTALITASQAGNTTYNSASTSAQFSVTPAALTITANNATKTYGTALTFAGTEFTASGLLGSDTVTSVSLGSSGAAANATVAGSTYPINASAAVGTGLGNYAISYVPGTLTVNAKAATVSADNKNMSYGGVVPTLTATSSGVVTGDILNYTLATTATSTSGVANYPITVALGSNPNYTVTANNGTLAVGPAAATVTANNKSKNYGDANPALDATVIGALNGDQLSYSLNTTATTTSGVGSYPITVTLNSNPNYTVTPVSGNLTVNSKTASVAADAKSKTYGDVNPPLTATVGGTANGDTLNYQLNTTAAQYSAVGSYPITVSLGTNPNYTVSSTDSTLSVGKKSASVAADSQTMVYGGPLPTLTATPSGTVNGDTLAYTLSTTATASSSVGSYPITVALGTNPNYNVTATGNTLTVTPAASSLTITDAGGPYNGTPYPATVTLSAGATGSYTVTYSGTDGAGNPYGPTSTAPTNAGSYTAAAVYGGDTNHTGSNGSVTFTISKLNPTVTPAGYSLVFDNAAHSATVVVTGLGGAQICATPSPLIDVSGSTHSAVGTYSTDSVVFLGNVNYNAASAPVTDIIYQVLALTTPDTVNQCADTGKNYATVTLPTSTVTGYYGNTAPAVVATFDTNVTVISGTQAQFPIGTTNVTYTVTDTASNQSTHVTFQVNVVVCGGNNPTPPKNNTGSITQACPTFDFGAYIAPLFSANIITSATLTGTGTSAVYTNNGSFTYTATPPVDPLIQLPILGSSAQYTFHYVLNKTAGGTIESDLIVTIDGTYAPPTVTVSATQNHKNGECGADVTFAANATAGSCSVNAPTIKYHLVGSTGWLSVANNGMVSLTPGSYEAQASVTDSTNTSYDSAIVSFTVASQPDYTVSVNITNYSAAYDGQAHGVTLVSATGSDNTNLTNSPLLHVPTTTYTNVGTYTVHWTFDGDCQYKATSGDATVTISQKNVTVTADNKTITYGDVIPSLTATVTGTANNETINYSLATTGTQFSGASTYPITVSLGSNPNYNVTANNGTLTINPKAATVKADNKSKTYGDANPALTAVVSGTVNGDSIAYTLATTATAASGVGGYPITVTLGSNPNYTVTSTDATLTVSAKAATITANDKSKTYGDANPTLTVSVTGTVNGDSLNYSLATTATTTSGVGGYPITVTLGSNPNYTVTPTNGTLTVNARAATVTANDKSKTYGDANPALDATVTGTVGSDTLSYSLGTTATTTSGVGGYPITVTLGSNPNYTVAPTNGTLTVNAKAATVTANDKSKTYGDANPTLDATVTGTVGGDVLSYTVTTAATTSSGVGGYPITVTLGSNPNYSVTPVNGTLTVSAKAATVTADAQSKTYGDANPTLTAVVTGTVNGDSIAYTLATTATTASGVGGYPITVTLGSNPNYTVTPTNATLTVTPKAATVTANNKSKTYGDANPTLNATVGGTVGTDTLNYSLATTATVTSGVGSYPIAVTLGSNPNYTVTPTNGSLSISPRPASVTANNKTKTYGDVNPTLTATVTGTANGDSLNYGLSTTAAQFSGVGSYPITVSLGSNPNYSVTSSDAALAIVQKAATVTANSFSMTQGYPVPALTATVTGQVAGGDAVNYTLSTSATNTSPTGSYPITVTLPSNPDTNPNYSVTTTNGNVTIVIRQTAITLDTSAMSGFNYDCVHNVFTGTLTDKGDGSASNPIGGATVTVTIGTQVVTVTTAGDGTFTGNVTLVQTPGTVTASASYAGVAGYQSGASTSASFALKGDPNVGSVYGDSLYTGSNFVWTTGPSSSTASLSLSATLKDTGIPCVGDITKATVSFYISTGGGFSPVSNAQNLKVGLASPTDPTVGTVSALSQYDIGNNAAQTITIRVVVGGLYASSPWVQDSLVTIAKPGAVNSMLLGATVDNTTTATSSGFLAPNGGGAGSQANASGYVAYNKSGSNPQGKFTVNLVSNYMPDGSPASRPQVYVITSNAISSMQLAPITVNWQGKNYTENSSSFTSKVTVKTQSGTTVDSGNLMIIQVTQAAGTTVPAMMSITVQKSQSAGGGLWYSSSWAIPAGASVPSTVMKPATGTIVIN